MKEFISRLARGMTDMEPPLISISPEQFCLETGSLAESFFIVIEVQGQGTVRGFVFCDDPEVTASQSTFLGKNVRLGFSIDLSRLPEGETAEGVVTLLSNAGEFRIPYSFRKQRQQCAAAEALCQAADPRDAAGELQSGLPDDFAEMPEDTELLTEVCAMLIREKAKGPLALALFEKAITAGSDLTHLYESYLAARPLSDFRPIPKEVLIYNSYERNLSLTDADKLYGDILRNVPEKEELYLLYEADIRDHAMKSVLAGRINEQLAVIYDRMLYPDMIDAKAAALLPDILFSRKITAKDSCCRVAHAEYPELQKAESTPFREGVAYLPVYGDGSEIHVYDAAGTEMDASCWDQKALLFRPDLLKRAGELCPEHRMLLFQKAKEAVSRKYSEEGERELLIKAMDSLDPTLSFRNRLIRKLCTLPGEISWMNGIGVSDLEPESLLPAAECMMAAGEYQRTYLFLREAGIRQMPAKLLSDLADALLANGEKPVFGDMTTDRFFLCLCRKLLDTPYLTGRIAAFLTEEYEGASADLLCLLRRDRELSVPSGTLSERILTSLLFSGTRESLDDTFLAWLESGVPKETLLKAFFVSRMTDYFEKENRDLRREVFEALFSYLKQVRFPEGLPPILLIGMTMWFSEEETLTEEQTRFCQKFTDLLISRKLVFRYTKNLRKKIRIPVSVCERYYLEYHGTASSCPYVRMRILPEETKPQEMVLNRVFRNVFVLGTILFYQEDLQYEIFDRTDSTEPVEEGVISVRKLRQNERDDRLAFLNRMIRAAKEKDTETLTPLMLQYAAGKEAMKELFKL